MLLLVLRVGSAYRRVSRYLARSRRAPECARVQTYGRACASELELSSIYTPMVDGELISSSPFPIPFLLSRLDHPSMGVYVCMYAFPISFRSLSWKISLNVTHSKKIVGSFLLGFKLVRLLISYLIQFDPWGSFFLAALFNAW